MERPGTSHGLVHGAAAPALTEQKNEAPPGLPAGNANTAWGVTGEHKVRTTGSGVWVRTPEEPPPLLLLLPLLALLVAPLAMLVPLLLPTVPEDALAGPLEAIMDVPPPLLAGLLVPWEPPEPMAEDPCDVVIPPLELAPPGFPLLAATTAQVPSVWHTRPSRQSTSEVQRPAGGSRQPERATANTPTPRVLGMSKKPPPAADAFS